MPYYFNLPIITDLTIHQQRAVNETKPLALSGGPGTGKSVVCLWRHIQNYATESRKSLLLTYTKTLEYYLRQTAISENKISGNHIDRTMRLSYHQVSPDNYDEIIIDEGQDLLKNEFEQLISNSQSTSYGADKRQSVYRSIEELNELFDWLTTNDIFKNNSSITLSKNFRNSKEILLFTRAMLPNFVIHQNIIDSAEESGIKPIMKVNKGWGTTNQINEIIGIITDFRSDTENIAILVPFAEDVENYYAAIRNRLSSDIECSKYQHGQESFEELSGIHVTTFKSSKGTEFDTVIIPSFDKKDHLIRTKYSVNENDYYVAFTRTKRNLFLICGEAAPTTNDQTTFSIEG